MSAHTRARPIIAVLLTVGVASCAAPTAPRGDLVPDPPSLETQIASGLYRSCVLRVTDGVWCWGGAVAGSGVTNAAPALVAPPQGAGRFVTVSVGSHVCALTAAGVAYCWGENRYGELGDGTTITRQRPTRVLADVPFRTVTAGLFSTCALDLNDRAWCWGRNDLGALGTGSVAEGERALRPVLVAGGRRFRLLSGASTWCGLEAGGAPYCWGSVDGSFDPGAGLEPGDCTTRYGRMFTGRPCVVPTAVDAASELTQIAVGGASTCGIVRNTSAVCWGEGWLGSLGDGTLGSGAQSSRPREVAGNLALVRVSSGGVHACGLTPDGRAYCWGSNFRGRLGNGVAGTSIGCALVPTGGASCPPDQASAVPVAVVGEGRFRTIAAGSAHTCALTTADEVFCWGIGTGGELGRDPGLGDSPVPVRVRLP